MNARTLPPSVRIALGNYGAVLAFCLLFGTLLHVGGDEPSLIGMKLLVVPLWYLSLGGLNAIYRQPVVEARWTPRAVERAVLRALLLGLMVSVIQWEPEQSLSDLLTFLGILSGSMTAFHLFELRGEIRRLRREATSNT